MSGSRTQPQRAANDTAAIRAARLLLLPQAVPRPLAMILPGCVYEITSRTIQQRFLLRPSVESKRVVDGIIGCAQELYPSIVIYSYIFMSNHWQMLVGTDSGEELAAFKGYIGGMVSREMGRLHGWSGPLFAAPARTIPIVDEEALVDRFRYVMSNSVKEGLVASPLEWPGASSVAGLLGAMSIVGYRVSRDLERRAKSRKRAMRAGEQPVSQPVVRLSPLPMWAHLSPEALREKHSEIVAMVIVDSEKTRRGKPPLGVQNVLAINPHDRPSNPKRDPAPLCHGTTQKIRGGFRYLYRQFAIAFRAATGMVTATVPEMIANKFPYGSYPRPLWFRHPARGVTLAGELAAAVAACPIFEWGAPWRMLTPT